MEVQLPLQADKKYSPPVGLSKKSGADTLNEPRSICILRLSSIGDEIHTLPVAELLKSRFPNARITWVVEKMLAPLLKHNPAIDHLILLDTKSWRRRFLSPSVWKEVFRTLRYLRSQRFDVALDFQGFLQSTILARFCGSQRRIGMSRFDRKDRWSSFLLNEFSTQTALKHHNIEKNLALLERLDIVPQNQPLQFHIHPEQEAIEYVERELKKLELQKFILVHAGGSWMTKRWDADKFAQLIDTIYTDLHIPTLLIWGPGEKHLADSVARKCISPAMVSFSTNLSELIALTQQARLMISSDSGPLHLASALGVPVVGIYGPTDPARNGPWNPHDSACTVHYECSPCNQRTCPIGVQCLKQLEINSVLDAAKKTFYLSNSLWLNQ